MARTKLRMSLNAGGAMAPVIGPNPSYCIWNLLFNNSPCVRNTIESEHYYSLMGGAEPIHANGMYSCFDSYDGCMDVCIIRGNLSVQCFSQTNEMNSLGRTIYHLYEL